jgi:hypothetical protein
MTRRVKEKVVRNEFYIIREAVIIHVIMRSRSTQNEVVAARMHVRESDMGLCVYTAEAGPTSLALRPFQKFALD